MALCRRCRVREASDLPWKMGLCPECYGEQKRNEEREEKRDRERREERDRQERSEREERRHRERVEEYERQAAEDAAETRRLQEQAAEDAAEAKRLAGLKIFTCIHCKAMFNEEQGVSAIKSPIGEPLCNDCLDLCVQCFCCHKFFWKDRNPIREFSYEYVDGEHIEKISSSQKMCFGCQNTQGRGFIVKQNELAKKFNSQK